MGRRIVIVRHAERMDFTYSDDWLNFCFPDGKTYKKHHANMPETVPLREGAPMSFYLDCPLTLEGENMGRKTGEGFKGHGLLREGFEVYVSPSLRSIQTAHHIAKGMDVDFPMRVEPCLFEWMWWVRNHPPRWMALEELKANDFKVDDEYEPYLQAHELNIHEDHAGVYERSHGFIQQLLSKTDKDILLVGHGLTLDVFTRQLSTQQVSRENLDFRRWLGRIPYCATSLVEQDEESGHWKRKPLPADMIRHEVCREFCAVKVLGEH